MNDVYEVIVNHYSKNRFVPTVREIAGEVSASLATIHAKLKELEACGYIIRKSYTSFYRLTDDVVLSILSGKDDIKTGDTFESKYYEEREKNYHLQKTISRMRIQSHFETSVSERTIQL